MCNRASWTLSAFGYLGGKSGLAPTARLNQQPWHSLGFEAFDPVINCVWITLLEQAVEGYLPPRLLIGHLEEGSCAFADVR